jgi:hypothetical protein
MAGGQALQIEKFPKVNLSKDLIFMGTNGNILENDKYEEYRGMQYDSNCRFYLEKIRTPASKVIRVGAADKTRKKKTQFRKVFL